MLSVSGYVFDLSVMIVPKAASYHRGEPRTHCNKLNTFLILLHLKYHVCYIPSLQLVYEGYEEA